MLFNVLKAFAFLCVTSQFITPLQVSAEQSDILFPKRLAGAPPEATQRRVQPIVEPSKRPDKERFFVGTVVTTGFSGTYENLPPMRLRPPEDELAWRQKAGEYRFIDLDGASATLTALARTGRVYDGSELTDKSYDTLAARDIGQVFGLAFDEEDKPGLYLTATSVFGLQIVGADQNGDLREDRLRNGKPDAEWMNGQWGGIEGAGPGSIYKLDGETGQISLFANVRLNERDNTGAALGNIAYNEAHQQLFVSDLETGMVHRFDLDGKDLEQFDHGATGRPNALDEDAREPVLFDPKTKLDIEAVRFDPFDPDSWNIAVPERRVWGVTVHGGRLFYAVADGPEIWSVGIDKETGAFLEDARWELRLDSKRPDFDISDIVFSPDGQMIVAQRPEANLDFDYETMTETQQAEVLRYSREAPEDDPDTPSVWYAEPQLQPVGFDYKNRGGLGGLAIGPGYDERGRFDWRNCHGNLWTTGEDLRQNDDLKKPLMLGGQLDVDGLQVVPVLYPAVDNMPPWSAFFHDYAEPLDPEMKEQGRVGDVEVLGCRGGSSRAPALAGAPKTLPPQAELPPNTTGDPRFWCTKGFFQAGVCLCALFPDKCFGGEDPKPACATVEAELICDPATQTYVLQASLTDVSGAPLDTVKLEDPSGTITSLPTSTAYPGAISVPLNGLTSGQTGQVNICAFDAAQQETGEPFSCCNTTIPFQIPGESCGEGPVE